MMPISLEPVALAHTPFKEKFAIPRQPALAPSATAEIRLLPPFDSPLALQGLEQVSHIWLLFQFHQALSQHGQAPHLRVRPPRLGGNEKIGVFASRATHRPNSLGQSVVTLDRIEGCSLWVSGIDLLDGTPILDIKPYVPYADAITHAENHIAAQSPELIPVTWQENALEQARIHGRRLQQDVVGLIEQCLMQDPKPAYQVPSAERQYGVQLWDLNVRWHYPDVNCIRVLAVEPV
ncbi:tRNA (N6-threonylcarbamoyladenosine(37)-N6)-methyltransferase TrmO [Bacterioplanoides sp. SCSIO 12839]|uniref:tRNA (N6-threonylcarbamoyladenosine(37)-N6)-methyltransferase TrmO n=1 Tax=Bacterioplanoides sp. SCSIO 12839 TaxID=2829569 RepID=UPI002104A432|nr:tRNA (N6-threonylcarbamoyladenosine(37)-N6)-methyltransferase TrmO [Bacterioplanoides sp. SCSIO 12839]UTW47264.1 tRNA (N6-threonylcarbamoyladenosine(37)-N6)-methyltransferase TrmO [Bacterioplanoides sp. SCSIO 12839]